MTPGSDGALEMSGDQIAIDDPRADDVRALLSKHLASMFDNSPPEDVHALDVDALADVSVTFFSFRRDGELLGVGALKHLDAEHAELKSMHTAAVARRHGIGSAMLTHLISVARERGYRRISLETGMPAAFDAARALYAKVGFVECGPFADYWESPYSCFMTMALED